MSVDEKYFVQVILLMIFEEALPYYHGHRLVNIKAKLGIKRLMLPPEEKKNPPEINTIEAA